MAARLSSLNRPADAIGIYDQLVDRFGETVNPVLQKIVAEALFNKGSRLSLMNRSTDTITTYDELARRFGVAVDPALRDVVARFGSARE